MANVFAWIIAGMITIGLLAPAIILLIGVVIEEIKDWRRNGRA